MRWKAKRKPRVGDFRVLKRFLFFPRKISEEYRWLEFGYIKQKLELVDYHNEDGEYYYSKRQWFVVGWSNYYEHWLYKSKTKPITDGPPPEEPIRVEPMLPPIKVNKVA